MNRQASSVIFTLFMAVACNTPAPRRVEVPRAIDSATAARWTADSTKYVKDSTEYARKMHVLDSISRTVPTDSLYRLYRATLTASDVVASSVAVACEQDRLARVYGLLPSEYAIKRMEDTLKKPGESDAWSAFDDRLANMTVPQGAARGHGAANCPNMPPRRRQDSFDGAPLSFISGWPIRPKPPGG